MSSCFEDFQCCIIEHDVFVCPLPLEGPNPGPCNWRSIERNVAGLRPWRCCHNGKAHQRHRGHVLLQRCSEDGRTVRDVANSGMRGTLRSGGRNRHEQERLARTVVSQDPQAPGWQIRKNTEWISASVTKIERK